MARVLELDEDKFERIFVFGDLHGSYELFIKMVEKINLTKNDLVVILGDSCDRGKDSAKLYYKYKEMMDDGFEMIHILGNHEEMLYYAGFCGVLGELSLWFANGGKKTFDSFKDYFWGSGKAFSGFEHDERVAWLKEWVEKMPHIATSKSYIFVHAGYDARLDMESQDEEYLVWSREKFWLSNSTGKEIYYGHTPNEDGKIHKRKNGVYSMDVGAVFFKKLRILEIKSKQEFMVSLDS